MPLPKAPSRLGDIADLTNVRIEGSGSAPSATSGMTVTQSAVAPQDKAATQNAAAARGKMIATQGAAASQGKIAAAQSAAASRGRAATQGKTDVDAATSTAPSAVQSAHDTQRAATLTPKTTQRVRQDAPVSQGGATGGAGTPPNRESGHPSSKTATPKSSTRAATPTTSGTGPQGGRSVPQARHDAPAGDSAAIAGQSSAASKPALRQPKTNGTPAAGPAPAVARKLFVLDTNVLLHDPSSLFRFAEHDVYLPMIVLEELDHQKKGMSEVARNARQVSRYLDDLVTDATDLGKGVPLDVLGHTDARGSLFFQTRPTKSHLPLDLPVGKADNVILGIVHGLREQDPTREIVLVSKDINMRLKARALGLPAEDYLNDHVLDDSDLLYDGVMPLPANFWVKHGKDIESWQQNGLTWYRVRGPLCAQFIVNEFVYYEGEMPLRAQVRETTGKSAVLSTLRDFSHGKNSVWGITARNREQNFALNLLMNPDIDFVSLLGQAGTGKTLLALASGLVQTFETRRYNEIIITRATVPVGDDIGFLPGTEEEKMLPWMGALEDNLEVLHQGAAAASAGTAASGGDWSKTPAMELIRSRIKVKSMNFMRGRTFLNKYLIIDEAQNLTPKQMKTLITRAGPGTKIICLGNIAQIDTPYLTEGSSGLTYVVDRFKGWPHAGHITLQRGERSRLADYASEVL